MVVKVQHEGIKTIILEVGYSFSSHGHFSLLHKSTKLSITYNTFIQDLKNAKSVVEWIVWAEPKFNFNPVIDEWCKEAPKELDFNREAGVIIYNQISTHVHNFIRVYVFLMIDLLCL